MTDTKAQTGIPLLDRHLDLLLEHTDPDRVRKLREQLEEGRVDVDTLPTAVPDDALMLAITLRNPRGVEELCELLGGNARDQLELAKARVLRSFEEILKHPVVRQRVARLSEAAGSPVPDHLTAALNLVGGISHDSTWMGRVHSLVPAARIAVHAKDQRVLLVTTMPWTDILFLVDALAGILVQQMQDNRVLAEQKLVDVDQTSEHWDRVNTLAGKLTEIKQLARHYGIDIDAVSERPSQSASAT